MVESEYRPEGHEIKDFTERISKIANYKIGQMSLKYCESEHTVYSKMRKLKQFATCLLVKFGPSGI